MSPGQSSSGGPIPRYPDQRGSIGCGQLGTGLLVCFWCTVPMGLQTGVSCPTGTVLPQGFQGLRAVVWGF